MTGFSWSVFHSTARVTVRGAAVITMVGMVLGLPARAATSSTGASASSSTEQKTEHLRSDMLKLRQKLTQIQREVIAKDKKLQHRQVAFSELLLKKMEKPNYHAKKEIAAIKQLALKLRDKTIAAAKRNTLEKEFRQKIQRFQEAQHTALATPELRKASHALLGAILAAMKKLDPNTDKLIAKLEQDQQELMKTEKTSAHPK